MDNLPEAECRKGATSNPLPDSDWQNLKQLILLHFPIQPTESVESDDTLTYERESAIRYIAGYVYRAVGNKSLSSARCKKKDLLLALSELLEDCEGEDETSDTGSSDWIATVNRGGLVRVTDSAYVVFYAIEQEVRTYLPSHRKCQEHLGEDVQFYWCMLACDITEEVAEELLKLFAKLWNTIHWFSFAKSYMELYKQEKKKTIQKSKALR